MQKEVRQQIRLSIASQVKKSLKGTPPSRLAAEYGLSTSTMSKVSRGLKSIQVETFIQIAEALGKPPAELMQEVVSNLPVGFTTIDQ